MPIKEKCVICGSEEWVNPSATEWGKINYVCLGCRLSHSIDEIRKYENKVIQCQS